jgi:hypothetical protein
MTTSPKATPNLPIGKIKTFGKYGPYYEITGIGHQGEDGEWMIPIRVVASGEELDYRYTRLALDPDAS